ncbi:HAMP domain-containing protein [Alginatibacterium sediminis]|uniref:histidine kinase n=1 Tax=Alginatibacterium sediminis TaxID=2164068 RepID=A0A420ENL6_9ALTE|nr:ATP-binding protein [Alginatibacterium sediminis]RKF22268.1 HAMP domain-containing protein [Alginatibacterium sediminis]
MTIRKFIERLKPKSLLSRMLLLMLLAIALAQGISSSIWSYQFRISEDQGLKATTHNLALSLASTVTFFESLPAEYRHIVLDQLRNMGGTRFFVSLNTEYLMNDSVPDTHKKKLIINEVEQTLHENLPSYKQVYVDFSPPETLRVFNNDILMQDLPPSWASHTLSLEPINPPILVTQIHVGDGEWIYLAALLPAPYLTLEDTTLTTQHWMFIILMTGFLLVFTYLIVRRQTKPMRNLAKAASSLTIDLFQKPLAEEGSSEIVQATRAFNTMQSKLKRYIEDREQLFRSISHDLKTPITRLRLRAELLDEEEVIDDFNHDLDELEIMAKGALQTVKDTDIHENLADIDIMKYLQRICEPHVKNVTIIGHTNGPYYGKPLAIKRCMANLLENGVKYGERVDIFVLDEPLELCLLFVDIGPGIPNQRLTDVFNPYVRLNENKPGSGLGLGIARNIAHAHGGEITLQNLPQGGLEVKLQLPHIH